MCFARTEEAPIRRIARHHAPTLTGVGFLLLAVAAPLGAQVEDPGVVLPTDSISGELLERLPGAFLVRADDGRELLIAIAPDSIETRAEVAEDSVARPVPHASVMEPRDMRFILRQLEQSDERDRLHVHYVTVGEAEPRRIAVWLSIESERVPGG